MSSTQSVVVTTEAVYFLERVRKENPSLNLDKKFLETIVQEMKNLGVYADDANERTFYAGFLSARANGLLPMPEAAPKSAAELELQRVSQPFSRSQQDLFEALFSKSRLVSEGDAGLSNRVLLLEQLQGREISDLTFGQALSRVANNGRRPLHFVPEQPTESLGIHSGKKFEDQGSVQLAEERDKNWNTETLYVNGRVNHAHNPRLNPEAVKPQGDDARWLSMANQLKGHTHSQTAEILKIYGADGRSTYQLRLNALKKFEGR